MTRSPLFRLLLRQCRAAFCTLIIPVGLAATLSTSQAATVFTAALDGASEFPVNASPGIGAALVTHDSVAHTLVLSVVFSNLLGPTTVAHIHAPTALPGQGTIGVAVTPGTLPGFPAGVTSGVYSQVLDLTQTSTYTLAFLTLGGGTAAGAESLLVGAMTDGKAYFNIHSTEFPGGEIRGFLAPVSTPEGGSGLGLTAGVLGALAYARRRQRQL